MPKRRQVKPKELIRALQKIGFVKFRSRGSHLLMKHLDGRRTIIPVHGGKDIPIGTLNAILKDLQITFQELLWG